MGSLCRSPSPEAPLKASCLSCFPAPNRPFLHFISAPQWFPNKATGKQCSLQRRAGERKEQNRAKPGCQLNGPIICLLWAPRTWEDLRFRDELLIDTGCAWRMLKKHVCLLLKLCSSSLQTGKRLPFPLSFLGC